VSLKASTKPHVHQKFEIFGTNIASTMACPMSKNGPEKGLRPLGVNWCWNFLQISNLMCALVDEHVLQVCCLQLQVPNQ
jgi:methyl coenzyme M reductase beta subunit